ncbi:MAG: hypothetical protein IJ070_03735 [Firmicutes bacterium]|nr:hypothetical protein [Bacillota bacterium]
MKQAKKDKTGKIDTSGLRSLPEKHEYDTARYFADRGHDVTFIPPNNSPKMHTPDFAMDGLDWEVKCPQGKSKRTIENNFRHAMLQSENIIFDLRRSNLSEDKSVAELEHRFAQKRNVKRLLVIKRNGALLTYTR